MEEEIKLGDYLRWAGSIMPYKLLGVEMYGGVWYMRFQGMGTLSIEALIQKNLRKA